MTHCNDTPSARSGAERGFSLVEVGTAMALMAIMLYGLHATMYSAVKGRGTVKQADRVGAIANDFVDRLEALPFGTSNGGASSTALAELFDDDQDLGTLTLRQIRVDADDPGHWFDATINGVTGRWRIKVSGDMNNDGDETDVAWREGRNDLLAIIIWFDDRIVLRTTRSAPVEETTFDAGANY